jgi:histidinol-phosphate aminotransferase
MISRRLFAARLGLVTAGLPAWGELALAQRARVRVPLAKDMVWLNANENPDGPPQASLEAMARALKSAGRYHFNEFDVFYNAIARSENLNPEQVLVGAGSSEVLHCAIDAFTSPLRPMITVEPVYELPVELARSAGRQVVVVKLMPDFRANVKRIAEEADKAGGGLIYLCNPNNPTSSITPKGDLSWLVANLPANTVLLLDEAYIHFGDSPELTSGLDWVRQNKPVIVTRTFSKIWGMAGMRVGFSAAPAELTERMARFINTVISWVSVEGAMAGLATADSILTERRASYLKRRKELCAWLDEREIRYIPPQANFVMLDVGRDARYFIQGMPPRGVAVGRPFPPLTNMLRVTLGTDAEMSRFRDVFWQLYRGA